MLMKSLLFWHIVTWAILAQFTLLPLYLYGLSGKVIYGIVCFLMVIGICYINLLLILPKWISKREPVTLLMEWFGLIAAATGLSVLLSHLTGVFLKEGAPALEWINAFLRALLLTAISLALSTGYKSVMEWFKNDRRNRDLHTSHLRMELELLKSKIDPHFLLNTLNSIYILAYTNSTRTANAVMTLSGIMKHMLYLPADTPVLLKDEITYIEQVIALHELRASAPLCLEYTVTGEIEGYMIQPLLLIAFIENIFKHGVINNPKDPALIRIDNDREQLTLTCRNQVSLHPANQGGFGLSNAKRLLELLYSGRHTLELKTADGHYYVYLSIRL